VHLIVGCRQIYHTTCPVHELYSATFACLEFTNQKNGVRGELIGLGRSGNAAFCPVTSLISRIIHLRQHNATPDTPLYTYYYMNTWHRITASLLTSHLRHSAAILGQHLGLTPSDISVRSLRSSGAMALLCGNVDTDRIRLLSRWRSDEMLHYLHVQAFPVVATISSTMLQHGNFALIPNNPHPNPRGGNGGL
jgi:hypothetical protein